MIVFLSLITLIIPFGLSQTSLFISSDPCNETSLCDGYTYHTSLDSIMIALVKYNNTNQPLILLLIPHPNNEHYLLGGEFRSNHSTYYNYTNHSVILDESSNTPTGYMNKGLFVNITNLTISPVFCSEFPDIDYPYCLSDKSQMVKINLKTSYLILQIEILNLQNIILDGSEDIYMLNVLRIDSYQNLIMNLESNVDIDNCIYNRLKCCSSKLNNSSYNKFNCNRSDIPYFKVLSYFDATNGLFSFILSSGQNVKVLLNMTNCIISNIWLPYRRSILYFTSTFIAIINNTVFTHNLVQRSNLEFTSYGGDLIISQSIYSNYLTKFNNESTLFALGNNTFITYENTNPGYTTNIQLIDTNLITSNLFSVFICLTYKDSQIVINYTTIQINNVQLISMDNKLFGIRSMTENNYDYSIYIDDAYSLHAFNMTIYNIIKPIGISNTLKNKFSQCNFSQNFGKQGGVINIMSAKLTIPQYIINIEDSLFDSNIAEQGGGLYYIGSGYSCSITINNVILRNNKAIRLMGGAIAILMNDALMNSIFNIQNITAINNSAAIGGSIFIKYFYLSAASPKLKTFDITINSSNFTSNYAYFISPDKYNFNLETSLLLSELPSKFTGVGGAIYLMCLGLCVTSITNNSFNFNYAELGGGGLYSSEAYLDSNSFINNSAIIGGGIYTQRFNYFVNPNVIHSISYTLFQNNLAICPNIPNDLANLLGSLSDLECGGGGAIYTALIQSNQLPLSIKNCEFIQNIASQVGGAIQGSLFNVINTKFKNNSANKGGALFGSDYQISDCEFISNKAINIPKNSIDYLGKGGAIFLKQELSLNRSFINGSLFLGNNAETSGGALYITSNPPFIDLSTVKFQQNKATIYGPNIAAFPISLIFWNSSNIENINYDVDFNFQSIASHNIFHAFNIESGYITKSLSIALLDIYGQIVSEDNSSQLILEPIYQNINAQLVINPYSVIASSGIYTFQVGSQIIFRPGLNLDVLLVSNAILLSPWKERQSILNLTFRTCMTGEIYQETICYKCPGGYYSLETDPYYQGSCQICDQNAICFGGDLICPKPGYWRKNSTADLIIPCRNADACLGSSTDQKNATISGNCSFGYKGNLCGVCLDGFIMFGDTHQCYDCQTAWYYYLIVCLIFFIKILIFGYSIHSSIKSTASEMKIHQKNIEIRKTVLMKILVNYSQLLNFAENFQINMPSFAVETVSNPSKISFNFSNLFSIDCYLNDQFSKFKINPFYLKALIAIILPMTLISLCAIAIFLPCEYIGKIPRIKKYSNWFINKRDYLFTALLVFLVYFHQEVLKAAFAFFECQNLYSTNNPEYYLVSMPELLCWSNEHIKWSVAVAIPTIFLWGIILPLVLMWLVTQKKHLETIIKTTKQFLPAKCTINLHVNNIGAERIETIKNEEFLLNNKRNIIINLEENSENKIKNQNTIDILEHKSSEIHFVGETNPPGLKYSFLTKGYKKSNLSRSWETYYMLRKFIMVLIIIFIPLASKLLSVLFSVIIVTLALLLQFTYHPFEDDVPNTLENLSMISVLSIYFIGIYFQGQGAKTFDIIMFCLLFLSIGLFIAKWIAEYIKIIGISMNNKIGNLIIKIFGNPQGLSNNYNNIESNLIINSCRNRNSYNRNKNFISNAKLFLQKKLSKNIADNDANKTFSHFGRNTCNTVAFTPKCSLVQQYKQINNKKSSLFSSPISPNLTVEQQKIIFKKLYIDENNNVIINEDDLNAENDRVTNKLHVLNIQQDQIYSDFALDLQDQSNKQNNDDNYQNNDDIESPIKLNQRDSRSGYIDCDSSNKYEMELNKNNINEELRVSDDYRVSQNLEKREDILPVLISQGHKKKSLKEIILFKEKFKNQRSSSWV